MAGLATGHFTAKMLPTSFIAVRITSNELSLALPTARIQSGSGARSFEKRT